MNFSSLTAQYLAQHNLQLRKQAFVDSCADAIRQGHKTFWMIPESDADSQFVAFVLFKSASSRPLLARAVDRRAEMAERRC